MNTTTSFSRCRCAGTGAAISRPVGFVCTSTIGYRCFLYLHSSSMQNKKQLPTVYTKTSRHSRNTSAGAVTALTLPTLTIAAICECCTPSEPMKKRVRQHYGHYRPDMSIMITVVQTIAAGYAAQQSQVYGVE